MSEKPQDFVQVPREPTKEMLNAAVDRARLGGGMSWVNRSPQMVAEQCYRAMIEVAPPAPGGWRTIETAPKDETKFDAWAVHPRTGSMGVRFTDVQMRGDGSGFGVIIHRPGVHWEYLEQDGPTYPEWKLTHWRPLPPAPGDEKGKGGENSASLTRPGCSGSAPSPSVSASGEYPSREVETV